MLDWTDIGTTEVATSFRGDNKDGDSDDDEDEDADDDDDDDANKED